MQLQQVRSTLRAQRFVIFEGPEGESSIYQRTAGGDAQFVRGSHQYTRRRKGGKGAGGDKAQGEKKQRQRREKRRKKTGQVTDRRLLPYCSILLRHRVTIKSGRKEGGREEGSS